MTVGDRLAHALCEVLDPFAGEIGAELLSSRGWSSITFAGERHRLRLSLKGDAAAAAADRLPAALADWDPDLRGHLLVDIGVLATKREEGGGVRIELYATTIELS